ncbi:hypothetical protein NCS57_01259200 [Fusarium keratoplasticum]|uniref:Uncharacterized protein n=1 Tax=Fusarium keratoplasticum TaxID=1328300 RepID=A0ACC0QJD4_9HYPO|nr:hypothetical protein NCS57_01259200 [Fusarium keratoplasticum]KAI8655115.1 hypothetical protein NCS57_01259200 [Fusarium keratoplasticum]
MEDSEVDYDSLLEQATQGLGLAFIADSLPLNTNSHVNDADSADTQAGMHIPEQTDWLNAPIPHPFNFNTPIPITDIDYTLHTTWYPDTMPILTEDSPGATLNSSSISTQSPGFSSAYSTSPLSTNYSPQEQLLPPSLGPTPKPTPTHASSPKKKRPQRRRAKAKPGTRPCDKRRAERKYNKKAQCVFCSKRVQCNRDLDRHYKAKHPKEAAEMGIDMRKIPCKLCTETFSRPDHLKRHMRDQHGIE